MAAQEPAVPSGPVPPGDVRHNLSDNVEPVEVPLGAPELSYRYVRTFGESTKAYLPDTQHINYPYGIGTDGTSLWVGELWGNRLLNTTGKVIFKLCGPRHIPTVHAVYDEGVYRLPSPYEKTPRPKGQGVLH